jgi:hypothetical protein
MANRIFLLDKSGSMDSVLDDTIGGFNSFVRSQVNLGGTLTLYTFSDTCKCEYRDVPIGEVTSLSRETYIPEGSTALYDSMGHILKTEKGKKSIFVILTDGQENASKKYTKSHIKDLIECSDMEIMYVGVDLESATDMGIRNTVSYEPARTPDLFKIVSESVTSNVWKRSKSQPVDQVCSTEAIDSTNRPYTSQ